MFNIKHCIIAATLCALTFQTAAAEDKVVVIPMAGDSAPQSLAVFSETDALETVEFTDKEVLTVTLLAPSNGVVIVNSVVRTVEVSEGDGVECGITTTTIVPTTQAQTWANTGFSNGHIVNTRGFNVMGGSQYTFRLICTHFGSSPATSIRNRSMTATFTPSP